MYRFSVYLSRKDNIWNLPLIVCWWFSSELQNFNFSTTWCSTSDTVQCHCITSSQLPFFSPLKLREELFFLLVLLRSGAEIFILRWPFTITSIRRAIDTHWRPCSLSRPLNESNLRPNEHYRQQLSKQRSYSLDREHDKEHTQPPTAFQDNCYEHADKAKVYLLEISTEN
jgi:hypothetical protein